MIPKDRISIVTLVGDRDQRERRSQVHRYFCWLQVWTIYCSVL